MLPRDERVICVVNIPCRFLSILTRTRSLVSSAMGASAVAVAAAAVAVVVAGVVAAGAAAVQVG